VFASLIAALRLPGKIRSLPVHDPAKLQALIAHQFSMAPAPIMLTTFLVAMFYCLDALYGERRDRSILFWKSLPVSDTTTVLAKVMIPMLVLPLIALVLSVVTDVGLMFASTVVLAGSGMSAAPLWAESRFFEGLLIMPYGLALHVLWFAPVYGWLLLVSAWARRAPFLWAVLPILGIGAAERIIFSTSHSMKLLQYRFTGAMTEAFVVSPAGGGRGDINSLTQLDPLRFLTAPGLWLGLAFAAMCIAAAIRLRRNRDPI
jgi:ABC-2 type transport system permease protein